MRSFWKAGPCRGQGLPGDGDTGSGIGVQISCEGVWAGYQAEWHSGGLAWKRTEGFPQPSKRIGAERQREGTVLAGSWSRASGGLGPRAAAGHLAPGPPRETLHPHPRDGFCCLHVAVRAACKPQNMAIEVRGLQHGGRVANLLFALPSSFPAEPCLSLGGGEALRSALSQGFCTFPCRSWRPR